MTIKHFLKNNSRLLTSLMKSIFAKKIPVYIPVISGDYLKGRCALISGGSSGIGYEIAKLFLQNQCDVVITGSNQKRIDEAIRKIKQESNCCNIDGAVIDIYDAKNISAAFNRIVQNHRIDILVNSAGVIALSSFERTDIDEFEKVLKVNIEGTYFLSECVFNYMKNHNIKGNILNISSTSSTRPATNAYSISKAAMNSFTRGLAKKGIDCGIVVNAIAPGPTMTKMLSKDSEDDVASSQYPLNRYILPAEIANLALFLVADTGRMIIGDTVFLSGGISTTTIDDIEY